MRTKNWLAGFGFGVGFGVGVGFDFGFGFEFGSDFDLGFEMCLRTKEKARCCCYGH